MREKTIPLFVLSIFLLVHVNCRKKFDEPPLYNGPMIAATMSIRELLPLHVMGSFEKIMDDAVIEGVITANDAQDNFYKTIIIQDSTAAITVKLDGFSLFNQYPVGRKLFIRLRGLWLGDYGGMVQLGAGVDRSDGAFPQLTGVPQPLFDRYVVKGALNYRIDPVAVTIPAITDSLKGMLIKIEQTEFMSADTGKSYADPVNKLAISHTLRNCGAGSIYLRTSAFAKFATATTPRGNGTVTGIYTVYKTQKQIIIRDTSDIRMDGLRCTITGPKLIFFENFDNLNNDSIVNLPGWKNIAEVGDQFFLIKQSGGNRYAEISAFGSKQSTVISWLITPLLQLNATANELLSFTTKDGFDNGAVLQAMVSTNYDGGPNPWKFKWTPLKALISKGNVSGYALSWKASGSLNLHGYEGNVYLAFRYEGNDPPGAGGKLTTTFRLDDIKIQGN